MKKYFPSNRSAAFVVIVLSAFFVVTSAQAASTVSMNLSTDGTLSVTGQSSLSKLTTGGTASTTGSELITNGTFNGSASGWTLGSNVTYNSNHSVTSAYSSTKANRTVSTTFPTVAGKTYLLTFTVSAETGPLYIYLTHDTLGSATGAQGQFENGTHSVALKTNYTGTETITFDYWDGDWWYNYMFGNPTGETWTLSNVSIKEVSDLSPALVVKGYDNKPWLSLGNDLGANTALGWNALGLAGDDSVYNTAIGANTLYHNTTGNLNTAVGWDALYFTTTGANNTAIGGDALYYNTTGASNVAIGEWTLINNTTGNANIAVGALSLFSNTTGRWNTAAGHYSLARNITGSNNVADGLEAMLGNITGSNNTASGFEVMYNNGSATNTVAVGYQAGMGDALYSNQGGTVVGYQAGHSFQTGSHYNTLFGYQAGYGITTGNNNIWIGSATTSTGVANLTTGSQNILIGNNISLPSATASGQLNIGNIIYGTNITGTGLTNSIGSVAVGSSTPVANFQVANGTNATTTMEVGSGGQNKGSCLKLYRTDGSAIYAYIAAGATTFTLTTTACANVSNF